MEKEENGEKLEIWVGEDVFILRKIFKFILVLYFIKCEIILVYILILYNKIILINFLR